MTAAPAAAPEVLRARPRRLLSRLWVRVSLVLLLIGAICLATWWWPRRTMVAVGWAGGRVDCDAEVQRATAILNWVDAYVTRGPWNHFDSLWRVLTLTREDRDITRVNLAMSNVGDEWLRTLSRFPQLTKLSLHDRQLGPGLDHLRDSQNLDFVQVHSVANQHLAELQRLPQLEAVSLWEPQSRGLRLDPLTGLPKLTSLFMNNCQSTNELLAEMPEIPLLETFVIRNSTGFIDDDLRHLFRFRKLKHFNIQCAAPLGDAALEHLSKQECLETLGLWSPLSSITRDGLQPLGRMKNLKQITVLRSQCTPAQLQMLRDQLPNCTITAH